VKVSRLQILDAEFAERVRFGMLISDALVNLFDSKMVSWRDGKILTLFEACLRANLGLCTFSFPSLSLREEQAVSWLPSKVVVAFCELFSD
jgi:hypothetical protein